MRIARDWEHEEKVALTMMEQEQWDNFVTLIKLVDIEEKFAAWNITRKVSREKNKFP